MKAGNNGNVDKSRAADLSPEWLQRYVEMRLRLDREANIIHSITSLLALFEHLGDDTIAIDPVALGQVSRLLNDSVLNIWEILDGYIYVVEAKLELQRRKVQRSSKPDEADCIDSHDIV